MCNGAQLFINDGDLATHLIDKIVVAVEPAAVLRQMELNAAQREDVESKEAGYWTVAPTFTDWASAKSGFAENEEAFYVRKEKNSKKKRTRDDRALHEKHEPQEPEELDIRKHEIHEKFVEPELHVNPDPFVDHDPWARQTHEKPKIEQPEKPDQVESKREPARERERDRIQRVLREIRAERAAGSAGSAQRLSEK